MIRYTIKCKGKCAAEFEGQFPDKKSFTKQRRDGMIQCPMCDGHNLRFISLRTKITKNPDLRLT